MSADLYAANHPARFWKLLAPDAGPTQWDAAIGRAAAALPHLARAGGDDVGRLQRQDPGGGVPEEAPGPPVRRDGAAQLAPGLPAARTGCLRLDEAGEATVAL